MNPKINNIGDVNASYFFNTEDNTIRKNESNSDIKHTICTTMYLNTSLIEDRVHIFSTNNLDDMLLTEGYLTEAYILQFYESIFIEKTWCSLDKQ